jgi:hypothetical protein
MWNMKRPFLLLEFMIALVLMGVIVAFLFSSYRDMSLTKATLQKEREEILSHQKMQLRLGQILSHLTKVDFINKAYALNYDNGIDPDPAFCGNLEGSLFLDAKKQLVLISTSLNGGARREVLCDGVHAIELQFFNRTTGEWDTKYPDVKPVMAHVILNRKTLIPFFL